MLVMNRELVRDHMAKGGYRRSRALLPDTSGVKKGGVSVTLHAAGPKGVRKHYEYYALNKRRVGISPERISGDPLAYGTTVSLVKFTGT